MKYLGINIGKHPSTIYPLNYHPLISKIVMELEAWQNLPLSLIDRCHLIKMVSFARLLYPLQTLPCPLKHADVNKLNTAFTRFIRLGKRQRIVLVKLNLLKSEGRLNFPNVRV